VRVRASGTGGLCTQSCPPASLSLVSDRFQADHPGAVGGSGSQIFTFKAHKAGTVQLTFRHFFRGRLLEQRQVAVTLS
jgi:Chagasin family peptidase inhibitor I42